MAPTSTDRFTLASNTTFTAKVQELGSAYSKTIIENSRSNPSGTEVTGVSWSDAQGIAERFLGDPGRWAGEMALAIVVDPAIDALFTGTPGAYPALTGVSPDPWDGPITAVLPYVFADFKDVV